MTGQHRQDARRFALRPDLRWTRRKIRGKTRWVARDPLTTEFYYFSDREQSFLRQLDGKRPLADLIDANEPAQRWQQQLLGRALRHRLLLGQEPGYGKRLRSRNSLRRRRSWQTAAFRLLAIRIPVVDPTPLLQRLQSVSACLFSRTSFVLLVLAAALLGLLLIGRWETVMTRLPSWQAMLTGDRVIGLLVAYVAIKCVHELSHAMATSRWGGECHEIGIFLLAFTPCLYCDVSDVWKLSRKSPRVMVAAAGIFAELTLAVLVGFVWFFSVEGPLNAIAFNIMFLASVGTLLVNANPLLRYDGYYILADLLDIPNLSEQSREALWAPLKHWLSAGRLAATPRDASSALLVSYGITSLLYRFVVLALILWGLNRVLTHWGFGLVGGIVTVLVATGVVLTVAIRSYGGMREIVRSGPVRWIRVFLFLGSLAGGVALAVWVPFEQAVPAVGYAVPADLQPVYAPGSGLLKKILPHGSLVWPTQTLAVLESPEDRYRIRALEAEIAELETEIEGVRSRATEDSDLATSLSVLKEMLRKRRDERATLRNKHDELTIAAATSGTLIEPAFAETARATEPRLTGWQGNPTAPENRGAWIEKGTLLGWIGNLNQWQVEAFVKETDAVEIASRTDVRVRPDQRPWQELSGRITKIDQQPLAEIPKVLRQDHRLHDAAGPRESAAPSETAYRVTITLDQSTPWLPNHSLVGVRIGGKPMPLVDRIQRYLRQTFRIDQPD